MDSVLNFINFFSPEQWAIIGATLAAALGAWGITALVKIRHLRKKGEKLWAGWVNLNVVVWPTLLTFIGAAVASLDQATSILSLIPLAAPYASEYGPKASIFLLTTHTIVSALSKFWADRKTNKPFANPTYTPPVEAVTMSGLPSSSMGTASVGMEPPKSELWSR